MKIFSIWELQCWQKLLEEVQYPFLTLPGRRAVFQITEVPGHSEPFKPFLVLCSCDVSVTSHPKTPNSGRVSECRMTRPMTDLYEFFFVPLAGRGGRRNERLEVSFGVHGPGMAN